MLLHASSSKPSPYYLPHYTHSAHAMCFYNLQNLIFFPWMYARLVSGCPVDVRKTCVCPCVVAGAYAAVIDSARYAGMRWLWL